LGWRWCHFLIWVWLGFHSCEISPVFPLGFSQQVVSKPMVRLCHRANELSLTLYQKSSGWRFQSNVSRISVWTAVQIRGQLLSLERECINVEEGLSLEREIVRNGGTNKGSIAYTWRGSVSMWRRDSHLRGRLLGIQVWV